MSKTMEMAGINDVSGDEKPVELSREFNLRGKSETMHLPHDIHKAIVDSQYFQELVVKRLKTFDHVVGEIYLKAFSLGPWESTPLVMWCGKGRKARRVPPVVTVAYCCLFRLFQMEMTKEQLETMLAHKDPHVRGVGFLYIRYNVEPEALWNWYKKPLEEDKEELNVIPGRGQESTIGGVLYSLLTKGQWFNTKLPPISASVQKQINEQLMKMFPVPPPPPDVLTGPPKKRPSLAEVITLDDQEESSDEGAKKDPPINIKREHSSSSSSEDEASSSSVTLPRRSTRVRFTRDSWKKKQGSSF